MSRLLLCWYLHSSIVYFVCLPFAVCFLSLFFFFVYFIEAHWFTETSSSSPSSSAEQKTAIRYRQSVPYNCNGTATKQQKKLFNHSKYAVLMVFKLSDFQIGSTRVFRSCHSSGIITQLYYYFRSSRRFARFHG